MLTIYNNYWKLAVTMKSYQHNLIYCLLQNIVSILNVLRMEGDVEKENVENMEATKVAAGSIKQIDRGVVHQICSGQVVLTLATAVKELVENSLDAGATFIEVKLRGQGAEVVEVTDNGHGVEEANFTGLTVKHATSKLREFSDLTSVETFGFRGEALSSLCALSKLTVSTRHRDAKLGTVLEYDHDGVLVSRSSAARPVGTTVTINNIFSTMPVRQKEFQRNIKKEYAKMMSILSAYGLVSRGVKIKVTNVKNNNRQEPALQTQGSQNIRENLVNIFGAKIMQMLKPIVQVELQEEDLAQANIRGPVPKVTLEGFISSPVHGEGRGAPDRQFLFINSRPCDHVKMTKMINQVYHGYNRHQFPFVCINIVTERSTVDVNITPDKRQIFLTQEKYLLELLKKTLENMFEDAPSTMPLQSFMSKSNTSFRPPAVESQRQSATKSNFNISNLKRSFSSNFDEDSNKTSIKKPRTLFDFVKMGPGGDTDRSSTVESGRDNCKERSFAYDITPRNVSYGGEESKSNEVSLFEAGCKSNDKDLKKNDKELAESRKRLIDATISSEKATSTSFVRSCDDDIGAGSGGSYESPVGGVSLIFEDFSSKKLNADGEKSKVDEAANWTDKVVVNEHECNEKSHFVQPNVGTHSVHNEFTSKEIKMENEQVKGDVRLCEDVDAKKDSYHDSSYKDDNLPPIEDNNEIYRNSISEGPMKRTVDVTFNFSELRNSIKAVEESVPKSSKTHFRAQISPSENETAESELRKQLTKDDFTKMQICGQFNLGFIIAMLNKDLFIVDQHASEEKYNFETLQRTTVIKSQKMVMPLNLELTSVNESILIDNIKVFEKNGFQFQIDETAPCTQRVKLVSLPMSKNWTFGKADIDELIFMLSEMGEEEPKVALRPSRVRAMFASRACRSAVMIGDALSGGDMARLVAHMADIEQPWNCPHGRPTIRHLVNTDMVRL